ncbi:E3 ubiquitin-protein ligase MIB2-like isoform X2 [Octopus vulgaris]|uniref:E3 ubiquitin-protein ligase MIB2-like isoform X2 n=1 Tax=Octopus vulgaris TaxID=6645 RepID=A0AA36MI24_OCTVU|nr:E3 ubiquitin-protein ligase MIB2-like isoform X2 [Octopus vulgaris]
MTMLDQFYVELKLGNEERCSGVVVASYLAHHGANFYCKNKSGRTPLDLIEKENLKKMLKTLFSPQCVFCEDEVATETFFPCKHLSLWRELGIKQVDLNIIKSDFPNDTAEQSFQMLYKWFQCCDPANRTLKTLTEALTEIECFDALERLSLDTN